MAQGQVAWQRSRPEFGHAGRTDLAGSRQQRYRAGRDLSFQPQNSKTLLAVQGAGKASPRIPCRDEAGPLQVVGRAGDSSLSHPAQRHPRKIPANHYLPPWRAMGPRRVGVQRICPVLRQPRLRRAEHELPRFHRIWQEIPRRRQQRMGPQDAGRCHLGRELPDRRRHCRSQACGHLRRFLRRLCHAGRRDLYSRSLRCGGGSIWSLQPDYSVGLHSTLLGGRTPDVLPAYGEPHHAGRQSPF
jgi:hypothetical protein